MKKIGKFAVSICLCMVLLTGCGGAKVPDVVDKPAVSVGGEGEVTVWQTGEFGEMYYNVAELAAMAEQEAADYNAEKGKEAAVTVEKVEALAGGGWFAQNHIADLIGLGCKFVFLGEVKKIFANFLLFF